LPALEPLEDRCLLSSFLQGTVFTDLDHDGRFTPGEAQQGATVTLYDATGTNQLASETTGADGLYLFEGLAPGTTYLLKETPPSGFTNQGTQVLAPLDPKATSTTSTTTATVPSDLQVSLNGLDFVDGRNPPYPAGRRYVPIVFTINMNNMPVKKDDLVGQPSVSVSGTNFAPPVVLNTFCTDLGHSFANTQNVYPVSPAPDASSVSSTANFGRIAYLYNHYGLASLSATDAAGLQLAMWELEYDTTPDLSSGNFYATGPGAGGSQSDYNAAVARASVYLSNSAGKSEQALSSR
jgi:hypothetical protein